MINVLINAYAVSPSWGSEPGMGWNWIINIAKYCKVFVITEGEWKEDILKAIKRLPQKDNLHFYFNLTSEKVRNLCWNQGDWRFYWYYRKWQKKTLQIAKDIISQHKIDILHQLNMIGFREPGYLWKIKDIPLVWGPIGGMGGTERMPSCYFESMGIKQQLFSQLKLFLTNYQIKHHPRVNKMIKRATIIGAVTSVKNNLKKHHNLDIDIIPETGIYLKDSVNHNNLSNPTFEILWVGRLIPTKRLDIALKAIAKTKHLNIRLTICGAGDEDQEHHYKNMISSLQINNKVNWLGRVPHDKIADLMATSDLFFMTSIADATSTVVVEAISSNLPILSFNACGFGSIVKDFAGEAVEPSTPKQSCEDFAEIIDYLIDHPGRLQEIRNRQLQNRHTLDWDDKAKKMVKIYESLLDKS